MSEAVQEEDDGGLWGTQQLCDENASGDPGQSLDEKEISRGGRGRGRDGEMSKLKLRVGLLEAGWMTMSASKKV